MTARRRGQAAEELASRYLEEQGLRLLERNVHCRGGELDLVMKDGETLVFVEVRSRNSSRYGSAEESITASKLDRLRRAAAVYLLRHPGYAQAPCRFDVVALGGRAPEPRINWIRDAFGAA